MHKPVALRSGLVAVEWRNLDKKIHPVSFLLTPVRYAEGELEALRGLDTSRNVRVRAAYASCAEAMELSGGLVSSESPVPHLYAQFVRLRQQGMERERAWQQIEREVRALELAAQERLVRLLREWEAREGRNYPAAAQAAAPYATQYQPPVGLAEARKKIKRIRRIRAQRSTEESTPPKSAAQDDDVLTCPECGTANPPGEFFCRQCGAMLVLTGEDTRPLEKPATRDAAYFDDTMTLALEVVDTGDVIRVRPRHNELVVGRLSPESVMIPDVDLSPYQADVKGVSRLHAALRRQGTTLVLTDMGSLNSTYINGQRVHAHEVRVIQDGDELQFGRLRVRAHFESE